MLSKGRAGVDNVYSLKEGMSPINLVSDSVLYIDLKSRYLNFTSG